MLFMVNRMSFSQLDWRRGSTPASRPNCSTTYKSHLYLICAWPECQPVGTRHSPTEERCRRRPSVLWLSTTSVKVT